jgi:hypothetical protein
VTTYLTKEQITERQVATARADAMEPFELTDADLANLSAERLSELLNAGQLARFGLGKSKIRRRG